MTQETLRKLNEMKLIGMADGFKDQLASTSALHLSFEERFALLVDQELTFRDNNRLKRLLQAAKLKEYACMEDINYSEERGRDRSVMASLAQCDWIHRGINVIFTGKTGSGKTWVACALGNQACRKGFTVLFQRLPLLFEYLAISHGDGTYLKRLAQLAKVDLLILDDFAPYPLKATAKNDLLEVIEQRSVSRSTIMTSQYPVEKWHDLLSGGNPTLADALLDRVLSGSHRIELKGESMRKNRGKE